MFQPGEFVGVFFIADGFAVGNVKIDDADAVNGGGDGARLIVVKAGNAAPDVAKRMFGEQGDAVVGFLPVACEVQAARGEVFMRDGMIFLLKFLQPYDVEWKLFDIIEQVRLAYFEGVDVPRGDDFFRHVAIRLKCTSFIVIQFSLRGFARFMREFRLFQAVDLAPEMSFALDESGHHHVARVLRRRVGDMLVLFNGDGTDYAARITAISRRDTAVHVVSAVKNERESPLALHLCLAWLKADAMDRAVQKAVELGVTAIYPFTAARTEGDKQDVEKKMLHWQGIVLSAATQCGRAVLPVLHAPQPFMSLAETLDVPLRRIASPWHDAAADAPARTDALALAIGAEGGFTDEEVAFAVARGWQPFTLGRRILRADTAVVAALACAQQEYGDF